MLPTAPAIEPQGPTHTFVAPWNAENVRFAPQEFLQGVGSMLGMGQPSAPQGPQVQAPKAPAQDITPFGHEMDVDPEAIKAVKKAGLSDDGSLKRISDAVSQGLLPGTPEFRQAVGVSAKQLGIQPSGAWGGLAGWADRWSVDRQNAMQKQQAADLVGSHFLNAAIQYQTKLQDPSLPKTVEEADALLGKGSIPRLPSQADYQGPVAPGGNALPSPALHPAQQMMAANAIHGIGTGGLMQTAEGIVPTQYASMQGRQITPDQALELQGLAGVVPQGEQPYQTSMPVPATAFNAALAQKGNTQRQNIRPVDLSQNFEGLLFATMAKPEFAGKYRSTTEFAAANPELTQQLRKQADVTEKRELYTYQQDEQAKRQIGVAGPIVEQQSVAHRNQPVAEPQLWRDPVSGRAADAQMTENQARRDKFVKLRPDQVETFNQLSTIDTGLEEVKELSKSLFKPETGTVGNEILRSVGQRGYLAYLRGVGDKRILKLDSIVTRLTAPLVKSQGDTANIAVAERQMFSSSLVNNAASLEAVLGNLDNVVTATKNARKLMGFQSREAFVDSLLEQGMTKEEIFHVLKKKGL